jgi:hypothetical protein
VSAVSAGAEGKRGRKVAQLALLSLCALATAACRGGSHAPTHLLDGEVAAAPPINLEGLGGQVVQTSVRVVPDVLRSRDPAVRACLRQGSPGDGRGSAVVRVGVAGKSVTFRTAKGRALIACDAAARGGTVSWCGRAYGRLQHDRLRDPRLDLACSGAARQALAFAWIEPSRRARYVVVRQRAYGEAYAVAAGLPVRVVTSEVDLERSRATFDVSEYSSDGRRLRTFRVETQVAG